MPPSDEDWNLDRTRFTADAEKAIASGQAPTRDHGAPLGPLAQQFATLTYSLLDATTTGEVLEQVVEAASRVVPGADLVSVTLRSRDGKFHTPVETDRVATELDQLQYDLGEGPCLDVADPAGPAVATAPDLAASTSWPRFGPAAADRGLGAVLSTALLPEIQSPRLSGALNIYSHRQHGIDQTDHAIALLLATHASLALAHTEAVDIATLQAEQLRRAIDSRDVIGQAKGILMARRGLTADEAFDLLRRSSQHLNVKLVELAETIAGRHDELELP
ncbi:GAF and ANTAR domain-containing protein [Lentzea sp. NEAU-D7]|uniref:GAF and ANTAR domain-containing protein n=1 Tax=Lentzea sp. NEAU-D7 TaxID=2994667 RepID=UPI00224AD6FA|nr:GAF and ANTAR domain-containing protein [Lentzea sp. NEAU-D7]MCX2949703.1 GAF and ANTAR domain-containing protein [Lentzea sp. NEAU-D7]